MCEYQIMLFTTPLYSTPTTEQNPKFKASTFSVGGGFN